MHPQRHPFAHRCSPCSSSHILTEIHGDSHDRLTHQTPINPPPTHSCRRPARAQSAPRGECPLLAQRVPKFPRCPATILPAAADTVPIALRCPQQLLPPLHPLLHAASSWTASHARRCRWVSSLCSTACYSVGEAPYLHPRELATLQLRQLGIETLQHGQGRPLLSWAPAETRGMPVGKSGHLHTYAP